MIESLRALVQTGSDLDALLSMTLLCSIRLFAVFRIFPGTSPQIVQGRPRSGIVVLLALFVATGQPADLVSHLGGPDLFILAAKEAFIGLLVGYAASTAFWVAEGVGAMIDNVAGYNNVQQQNPLSSSQSTPVSALLLQLCVTVFYVAGGFLFLTGAVFESYRWWPVATFVPTSNAVLERFVILQTDTLMTQIVKVASPVLVIMVLIDLGFGLVAKAAGKLEPNSLAQPVKSATALLVVMLSLAVFIQQLESNLSLADFGRQIRAWVGTGTDRP